VGFGDLAVLMVDGCGGGTGLPAASSTMRSSMGFKMVDAPLRLSIQTLAPGSRLLSVVDSLVTSEDQFESVCRHEKFAKFLHRLVILSS